MANTRHQEVDEAGERDLEIVWMGVAVARLEVGEAVERTPECSSHMDALGVVEIEAAERSSDHIDDAFDRRLQFVVAGAWDKNVPLHVLSGLMDWAERTLVLRRGHEIQAALRDEDYDEIIPWLRRTVRNQEEYEKEWQRNAQRSKS